MILRYAKHGRAPYTRHARPAATTTVVVAGEAVASSFARMDSEGRFPVLARGAYSQLRNVEANLQRSGIGVENLRSMVDGRCGSGAGRW